MCYILFKGGLFNKYQREFKNTIVVSLDRDTICNNIVKKICIDNKIFFRCNNKILVSNNRLRGIGHLNEKGNYYLGSFLYEVFNEYLHQGNEK